MQQARSDLTDAARPQAALGDVFRAEIHAARLEGALRADAELAALWRGQAAVQEACASAWLEDLPVTPEDLLCRGFRDRVGDADRDRASLTAAGLLRGLHSPGPLETNPEEVLTRLWTLAAGDRVPPFLPEDFDAVRAVLAGAESPILGALSVARLVGYATEGRAPAVERLAFVAADHALRGSGRFMLGEAEPHALVAAPRGVWVLQPALGLVDNGFRLWSVAGPERTAELLAGLSRTLERGLGALPMLRRWLEQAGAASGGAHGASRLPQFLDLLKTRPIVTGPGAAQALQITPRGAQKLIDQAAELGLVAKITPRATWRAWAVTPFARMLGRGPVQAP